MFSGFSNSRLKTEKKGGDGSGGETCLSLANDREDLDTLSGF